MANKSEIYTAKEDRNSSDFRKGYHVWWITKWDDLGDRPLSTYRYEMFPTGDTKCACPAMVSNCRHHYILRQMIDFAVANKVLLHNVEMCYTHGSPPTHTCKVSQEDE